MYTSTTLNTNITELYCDHSVTTLINSHRCSAIKISKSNRIHVGSFTNTYAFNSAYLYVYIEQINSLTREIEQVVSDLIFNLITVGRTAEQATSSSLHLSFLAFDAL